MPLWRSWRACRDKGEGALPRHTPFSFFRPVSPAGDHRENRSGCDARGPARVRRIAASLPQTLCRTAAQAAAFPCADRRARDRSSATCTDAPVSRRVKRISSTPATSKLSRSRREKRPPSPLKPPMPGRAGEQRGDTGDDAGDATALAIAKRNVHPTTLRHGIAIKGAQGTRCHQPGASHGRAGMAGETHRIGKVVLDQPAFGSAKNFGQRVMQGERGNRIEKGRKCHISPCAGEVRSCSRPDLRQRQ